MITDSLWMRAFWVVAQNARNNDRETVEFSEVNELVLHWSKMPMERLIELIKDGGPDT